MGSSPAGTPTSTCTTQSWRWTTRRRPARSTRGSRSQPTERGTSSTQPIFTTAASMCSTTFTAMTLAPAFMDPAIPSGFAPFGIANIGGNLYVTYAKQDDDHEDDVAGPGL